MKRHGWLIAGFAAFASAYCFDIGNMWASGMCAGVGICVACSALAEQINANHQ